MSMEIHVLFHGKLPSKAALTRCFKELGFPLSFQPGTGTLERHKGYLPMRLRGEESGIEFDTHDGCKHVEEVAGKRIDARFTRSTNFRWGGDKDEFVVALCFAAALAKLTDGAVFDPQEGELRTFAQASDVARKQLATAGPTGKPPGTREADLKRYLAPLLEMRDDLVLVGRLLLVRPVRHLLRGAYFEPMSNKHRFRVWRYITPLFDARRGRLGCGGYIDGGRLLVWQPHFEPLLIASLAEGIFEPLGKITTLTAFAAQLSEKANLFETGLSSLFLDGAPAAADDYVAQLGEDLQGDKDIQSHLATLRETFSRDVGRACAQFHAKEAAAVKELKLQRLWQSSPFAAELSDVDRASRSAEPLVVTTPWPTRPSWLWQDMPQQPGEVRFAKDVIFREPHPQLMIALSSTEAEERHRLLESYVLAARLADGVLLLVRRSAIWDRHSPQESPYSQHPREPSISIDLHGYSHVVFMEISRRDMPSGTVRLHSFLVREKATWQEIWRCHLNFTSNTATTWDDRNDPRVYREIAMTPAELELAVCAAPAFGEYVDVAGRFRSLLRITGFGEVT